MESDAANDDDTPVMAWDDHPSDEDDDAASEPPAFSDGEDPEPGEDSQHDFSDQWLDEFLPSGGESSHTATTSASPSPAAASSLSQPSPSRKSALLNTRDASDDEVQDHPLDDQAPEYTQATDPDSAVPSPLPSPVRRSTSASALIVQRSERSADSYYYQRSTQEEPSPRDAAVHPLHLSTAGDVSVSSFSPHKRSASVYVTPTSASKVLMKRPESISLTTQLWTTNDATKRNSRLLDEWKRKEIWHDFKRAEESVAGGSAAGGGPLQPSASLIPMKRGTTDTSDTDPSSTSVAVSPTHRASDARLDSLLNSLRQEISSTRNEKAAAAARGSMKGQWADQEQQQLPVSQYGFVDRRPTITAPTVEAVASSVAPPALNMIARAEYDLLVQEKRSLQEELDSRNRASTIDKETIRTMNEKLLQLENVERESKFLKEEIQKHLMQDLSSKERIKTLTDKLSLTTKSEEQLKFQTKQLMQQNQSLQSDLLEKIAAETAKIQKMAHLSAEKQNLMQEMQRKDSVSTQRDAEQKRQARRRVLRRLLTIKRRTHLQESLVKWKTNARDVMVARAQAFDLLRGVFRRHQQQTKVQAFDQLRIHTIETRHNTVAMELRNQQARTRDKVRELSLQHGLLCLETIIGRWETSRMRSGFTALKYFGTSRGARDHAVTLGGAKLSALFLSKQKHQICQAFGRWRLCTQADRTRVDLDQSRQRERDLMEAKDCVFSLSRAKTKLEDKLNGAHESAQLLTDQLAENKSELELVKHGFVCLVLRDAERSWIRDIFTQWRLSTSVLNATKHLRLQAEMGEVKAAEREKYSKSLEDYNRVLRNDLERFQFFSQDKRVTVDVLTKKLLREEEKYKQMEEHHALLEEKAHSLKRQLTTFVEWEGLSLPLPMLSLCKDIVVTNLRELFLLHATVIRDPSNDSADLSAAAAAGANCSSMVVETNSATPRLSMDALLRMIEYSNLLHENKNLAREDLAGKIVAHLPEYAVDRGLLFADFLVGVDQFLNQVFRGSQIQGDQMKAFWASLLALMGPLRGSSSGSGGGSVNSRDNNIILCSPRPAEWAGKLSDDILQNQEKLLAVLEHETAVVERAVMEKSSLKHTYPSSEPSPSIASSTFYEYQCDPLLPPEPSNSSPLASTSHSPVQQQPATGPQVSLEAYTNWHQSSQIRDLFLAFQQPLLKIVVKYSNEKRDPNHGNQFCLQLSGITQMLQDMKLYPTYLSREVVHRLFGCHSERDGLMTPPGFTVFLGTCALDLYAKSLGNNQTPSGAVVPLLSAREILLSFFCDLGFHLESEVPPVVRICYVGMDIENILWPLFEYYAKPGGGSNSSDDELPRVGMTSATFATFMAEIAGGNDTADALFRRVMRECHKNATGAAAGTANPAQWRMHFDEFYVALSFLQGERQKGVQYPNPGEAVRQWMQQTQ